MEVKSLDVSQLDDFPAAISGRVHLVRATQAAKDQVAHGSRHIRVVK